MTTARSSTAKLRERLGAVRTRRALLLAEQAETERRPITRDEAVAALRAYLDTIVAQASRGVDLGAAAFTGTTVSPPMTSLIMPSVLEPAFGAWLVDLVRPVLEERLTVALDGMDWSRAISAPDRVRETERLASDLARAEREEEAIVRQLEALNEDVDRRPDVDPRLVCLPDSALNEAAA